MALATTSFLAFQIVTRPPIRCPAAKVFNLWQGCAMRPFSAAAERATGPESASSRDDSRNCCTRGETLPQQVECHPTHNPAGNCGADGCTGKSHCSQSTKETGQRRDCPLKAAGCDTCIQNRFIWEATRFRTTTTPPAKTSLAAAATRALEETNRQLDHRHGLLPPVCVMARAGPDLRIQQCSFLL